MSSDETYDGTGDLGFSIYDQICNLRRQAHSAAAQVRTCDLAQLFMGYHFGFFGVGWCRKGVSYPALPAPKLGRIRWPNIGWCRKGVSYPTLPAPKLGRIRWTNIGWCRKDVSYPPLPAPKLGRIRWANIGWCRKGVSYPPLPAPVTPLTPSLRTGCTADEIRTGSIGHAAKRCGWTRSPSMRVQKAASSRRCRSCATRACSARSPAYRPTGYAAARAAVHATPSDGRRPHEPPLYHSLGRSDSSAALRTHPPVDSRRGRRPARARGVVHRPDGPFGSP